jgi:hypothetical protein
MVDFVMLGQDSNQLLTTASRIVIFLTTILNFGNLCSQAVAAKYLLRASSFMLRVVESLRSPAFDPVECYLDDNCPTIQQFQQALDLSNTGQNVESYGNYFELISLLIIVAAFLCAGAYCIRRFRKSNARSTAISAHSLQRQITVTVATVFITFLIRSAYAAILGMSKFNTDVLNQYNIQNQDCNNVCLECQGLETVVQAFDKLTPELRDLVFLLSSPLTMLVALWGMTSAKLRQVLLSSGKGLTQRLHLRQVECSGSNQSGVGKV